mgnify:CR=1 FL=1
MKKMWKKYSKNKMSVLGFVIIVLLLILVIFADLYVGYDKVLAQDVKNKLQSPSLSHICGTDNLGRDLFARLIYGARVSLGIGVAATFAGMMIGCILGVVISVTERDYVTAAKVSGVSTGNIILKYIIPNAAGVLITNGAFYLADTLLASSGLSFLGIGVQPPVPEWGSILSSGLEYMNSGPHIVILSGLFIAVTTVGITLIGDGLRDVFE